LLGLIGRTLPGEGLGRHSGHDEHRAVIGGSEHAPGTGNQSGASATAGAAVFLIGLGMVFWPRRANERVAPCAT
jgi:hypothetical protein